MLKLTPIEKDINLLQFALNKSGVSPREYMISTKIRDDGYLPASGESGYGLTRIQEGWLVYRFDRAERDSFARHDRLYDAANDFFMRLNHSREIPKRGMYAFREEWEKATGLELELSE